MAEVTEASVPSEVVESPETTMNQLSLEDESTTVVSSPEEDEEANLNDAQKADFEFVRRFITPAATLTLTKDVICVVVLRTAYSRIQLRCQFPPSYPQEIPIIELSSPTLPLPLLRNKEKECSDKVKTMIGSPQFETIYEMLHSFVHQNYFIPCWKEMKQVSNLCEGKGQLSVNEKDGLLQMKLSLGKYKQNVQLKIPYNYPENGVQVEFLSSNLPSEMVFMYRTQVQDLVQKCEAGFDPEQIFNPANQTLLPNANKPQEPKVKLTTDSLKGLKHDVNVLKQMSELRAATTASSKGKYFTEANAERKEARKDLRRLAKAELEADQAEFNRLMEEEQQEMKSLLSAKVSDSAIPSLLPAVKFIVEEYVVKMTSSACQHCKKPLLPPNSEADAIVNPRSERRALRSACGHWVHWCCMNEMLTIPPFIRQCQICNRKMWHPDWPEDHKQLEKAYNAKEARKREMSDVADMMGF